MKKERENKWERERETNPRQNIYVFAFFVFFFLFIVLLSKHDNFLAINRVVFALIGHTHKAKTKRTK